MGRRWVRGTGRGRKTRRTLERGGTGPAATLNELLGAWPGVRIRPMFGRWGYFVGDTLFACFPLRPKDADLWVRLTLEDQRRAVGGGGFVPHRRLGGRGWVECRLETPRDVGRAIRWLQRSYESVKRTAAAGETKRR